MASAQEENNTGSELDGNISGTYFSENCGEIFFIQRDNQVSGTYPNGNIEGTLTGNTLEGRWAGPWVAGRMRLKFSSDASSFSGYEAYGNLEPEANNPDARPWSRTRIGSCQTKEQKHRNLCHPQHQISLLLLQHRVRNHPQRTMPPECIERA